MRRLSLLLAALTLLRPAVAEAHLVSTGLGPIYDGISHVFASPDDLLPAIMMGLLAGLNGVAAGRQALFLLPTAWLMAGCAGLMAATPVVPGAAAAGSFLVLGGLTALDRRWSARGVTALAVLVGLLHGWLNGTAIAADQQDWLGLIGIAATVFVLTALSAAPAVTVRAAWARTAIRVTGSWMAAAGLLMLGWSLRAGS